MKLPTTGSAGFIGFRAAREFPRRGWDVVGIGNFGDYRDVRPKRDRTVRLEAEKPQGVRLSLRDMHREHCGS